MCAALLKRTISWCHAFSIISLISIIFIFPGKSFINILYSVWESVGMYCALSCLPALNILISQDFSWRNWRDNELAHMCNQIYWRLNKVTWWLLFPTKTPTNSEQWFYKGLNWVRRKCNLNLWRRLLLDKRDQKSSCRR